MLLSPYKFVESDNTVGNITDLKCERKVGAWPVGLIHVGIIPRKPDNPQTIALKTKLQEIDPLFTPFPKNQT